MSSNTTIPSITSTSTSTLTSTLTSTSTSDLNIDLNSVYVDNTFNLALFNKKYDEVRKQRQQILKQQEQEKLNQLGSTTYSKQLHEYTIGELIINMKNSIFGLMKDLLQFKFTRDTLLKENRLFYIGILITIIILIIYVIEYTT